MTLHLQVAVAVIQNSAGQVLITKRALHRTQGGLWEFPGGKIERQEEPSVALKREIREELGLSIRKYNYLFQLTHEYAERTVTLWVYRITQFEGTPQCCEDQQDLQWVAIDCLKNYPLLEASMRLIPELMQNIALCV